MEFSYVVSSHSNLSAFIIYILLYHISYVFFTLFAFHLMTLSVAQTLQSQVIEWLMNNEMERICMEVVMA
jgi:hypothetical protein